jgi:hypothetical protein
MADDWNKIDQVQCRRRRRRRHHHHHHNHHHHPHRIELN